MFPLHHMSAGTLILCGFASVAWAEDPSPISDKEFVAKAISGGMFEVESSKIAKKEAKKEDLKTFADQMITDHHKASKELKEAAQKAGIEVPTKMTANDQKMLTKIWEAQQRGNLDRIYTESQVKAHEEAVSLFSRAARSLKDPGLKKFAEKTLPIIEGHYGHIKRCAADNKG